MSPIDKQTISCQSESQLPKHTKTTKLYILQKRIPKTDLTLYLENFVTTPKMKMFKVEYYVENCHKEEVFLGNIFTPRMVQKEPFIDHQQFDFTTRGTLYSIVLIKADPIKCNREKTKAYYALNWLFMNIDENYNAYDKPALEYVEPESGPEMNKYVFLVYKQGKKIDYKKEHVAQSRNNFHLNRYVADNRLELVAANFFYCRNPTAVNLIPTYDYTPLVPSNLFSHKKNLKISSPPDQMMNYVCGARTSRDTLSSRETLTSSETSFDGSLESSETCNPNGSITSDFTYIKANTSQNNAVQTISRNNVAPTTSNDNVAPSTSRNTVAPSTSINNVAPTTSHNNVSQPQRVSNTTTRNNYSMSSESTLTPEIKPFNPIGSNLINYDKAFSSVKPKYFDPTTVKRSLVENPVNKSFSSGRPSISIVDSLKGIPSRAENMAEYAQQQQQQQQQQQKKQQQQQQHKDFIPTGLKSKPVNNFSKQNLNNTLPSLADTMETDFHDGTISDRSMICSLPSKRNRRGADVDNRSNPSTMDMDYYEDDRTLCDSDLTNLTLIEDEQSLRRVSKFKDDLDSLNESTITCEIVKQRNREKKYAEKNVEIGNRQATVLRELGDRFKKDKKTNKRKSQGDGERK
jgi:hypothetical protein